MQGTLKGLTPYQLNYRYQIEQTSLIVKKENTWFNGQCHKSFSQKILISSQLKPKAYPCHRQALYNPTLVAFLGVTNACGPSPQPGSPTSNQQLLTVYIRSQVHYDSFTQFCPGPLIRTNYFFNFIMTSRNRFLPKIYLCNIDDDGRQVERIFRLNNLIAD